jgi:RNA polymerase subunit RPABC4/transcription elongation factor Spt4
MTELQKEYCQEKGLIYIKPENTEIADYVNWLETQIQALRIHDVVGQSEQLFCPHCEGTDIQENFYTYTYGCNSCGHSWAK